MEASNTLNELVERIRSWIPRRVEAPASTMSRDFWMPDRSCRLCYECESQFTIFNRRHHCRLCGRVFCGKCSFNTLPASVDGLQGVQSEEGDRVRVCNFCYNNCEQASTPNGQTPTLTPSSSGRSLASSAIGAGAPVVSTIAPEQTFSGGSSNRQLFPDVAHEASPGKKHKMRKYQDGSRVHGSISPRARDQPPSPGIYRTDDYDEKGNYEGEQSYSRPNQEDDDIEVYSAAELDQELGSKPRDSERKSSSSNYSSQSSMGHRSTVSDDGAEGLKRTESCIYGKEDEGVDEVGYADAIRPEETAAAAVDYETNDEAWYPPPSANPDQEDDDDIEDDVGPIVDDDEDDEDRPWGQARSPGSASSVDFRREKTASEEHRKAMRAQVDGHFRALVAQFLYQEFIDIGEPGDPDSWLEIVSSLSWQAASYVKPDKGGGMDPGGYVKVKCIASGKKSDSVIVKGVVCRKNVAHRRMTSKFKNPRVLLLGGALEYQRVSNQLSSLDTLLQQEKDHLSMTVARIEAHHPNVLLVEKTVSRYAQDTLLNKEITLALNVKKTVLERIARCIGAQVAGSPDNLLKVKLGYCENFKVEKYTEEHGSAGQQGKQTAKHLMFFENCPRPQGCTVLLKGANGDELKKVKTVMNLTVFAAYHLALETSFLADEGATVPDLPAQSPMSITRSSSKLNVEKSGAAAPGFVMPPPVRTRVTDPPSLQGRGGQGTILSVSPLPVRTGSLGTAGAYSAFDNGNPTTPVTVPFSASSSCVSSATNSPGTSPAQNTTFGFQSGMVRGGTTGGISVSTFHIANGVYPGGQSREGVSGLSVYLKKGSSEGMESGTPGHEGKASDVYTLSGNVTLPDSERTTTTEENRIVNDGGANSYQGANEDVGRHLTVDVQDSWQCEMQMSTEDFPPADHQNKSILVQLSSRCLKKRNVCKPPHFLRMQFYGNADKPLGSFLRDSLFDTSQKCVQCDEPVNAHVYCFTHHQGSLTISVRRMKDDFVLPGERDGKIWMWHRCLKCPPVNGVPPATPRVVMSDAAWGLSFGKFLELSFSNHEAASRVAACGHSLHRHFLRFYGFGSMVACFRYAEIKLNSVYLPPLHLEFSGSQQEEWLKKEVEEVSLKMDTQYYDVQNKLREFGEKVASSSSKLCGGTLEVRKSLALLQEILLKERAEFKEFLERACPTTRVPGQHDADILQLNSLRRQLLISNSVWEQRLSGLQSAMASSKKRYVGTGSMDDERLLSPAGSVSVKAVEGPGRDSSVSETTPNTPTKTGDGGPILRFNTGANMLEATSLEDEFNTENESNVSGDLKNDRDVLKSEESADANGLDFRLEKEDSTSTTTHPGSSENLFSYRNLSIGDSTAVVGNLAVCVPASVEGSFLETDGSRSTKSEEPDRATPRVINIPAIGLAERRALSEGSYPLLADLSDSLSPWTGKVNADEKQKLDLSTEQVVDDGQTDEVGNAEGPLRESHCLDRATSGVDPLEAGPESPEKVATVDAQPSVPTSPVKALQKPKESADEAAGSSNKTFSRTSSNISTASDVPRWPSQALQLLDGDPRVLLPPGHEDVVVAVYDEEATSLIAYAISTKEHYAHVTDIPPEREKAKEREERDSNLEQIFHPLQQSGGASDNESSFKASTSFFEQAVAKLEEIENPLTSTKASQMVKKTINFGEDSSQGKVKFSVVCYFAKQFDALRKKCCKGNTEYVRSLSRCKKWGAQGGKSNVFFAKTADDRFVVKQVTRTELNSFLDFAPAYFKYLFEALTTGNPTCLAKILGVYEVKVTRGSRETKMDVIVMENLLFGRKISRLYDLKGSKRSRYNTDTSGKNQVLLDSNLLESMPTSPIFVGNKAKRLLERAVWNDTHFLSLVSVMDYSLLVGVDEERKELVVGIIDFMRQYTWDKHLETWVKASGILGGPKDAAPTVISPKQYKKRFRKAMSTYFLMVPDVWVPAHSVMLPLGDSDEKCTSVMAKDDDGGEDSTTPMA